MTRGRRGPGTSPMEPGGHSTPLVRRDAARRLDAHGVAQAPGETLERGFDDVVHVAPGTRSTCSVIPALVANDDTACSASCGSNAGLPSGRLSGSSTSHATNGRPDRSSDDLDERLVEREQPAGEAPDAGLVAERLRERLTERDRDVLDGVVGVDVQVARRRARRGRTRRGGRAGRACGRRTGCRSSTSVRTGAVEIDGRPRSTSPSSPAGVSATRLTSASRSLPRARRGTRSFSSGVPIVTRRQSSRRGQPRAVADQHAAIERGACHTSRRHRAPACGTARSWRRSGTRRRSRSRASPATDPLALVDDLARHGRPSRRRTAAPAGRRSAWRRRGGTAAPPCRARRRTTSGRRGSRGGRPPCSTSWRTCARPRAARSSATRSSADQSANWAYASSTTTRPGRDREHGVEHRRPARPGRSGCSVSTGTSTCRLGRRRRRGATSAGSSVKSASRSPSTTVAPVMRAMWPCSWYVGSNVTTVRPGPA